MIDYLILENPEEDKDKDFIENINPDSLKVLTNSKLEKSLENALPGSKFQFERNGYFCVDSKDSNSEKLVFNRTVTLRDSWSKIAKN